jgi:hypothetical protein
MFDSIEETPAPPETRRALRRARTRRAKARRATQSAWVKAPEPLVGKFHEELRREADGRRRRDTWGWHSPERDNDE